MASHTYQYRSDDYSEEEHRLLRFAGGAPSPVPDNLPDSEKPKTKESADAKKIDKPDEAPDAVQGAVKQVDGDLKKTEGKVNSIKQMYDAFGVELNAEDQAKVDAMGEEQEETPTDDTSSLARAGDALGAAPTDGSPENPDGHESAKGGNEEVLKAFAKAQEAIDEYKENPPKTPAEKISRAAGLLGKVVSLEQTIFVVMEMFSGLNDLANGVTEYGTEKKDQKDPKDTETPEGSAAKSNDKDVPGGSKEKGSEKAETPDKDKSALGKAADVLSPDQEAGPQSAEEQKETPVEDVQNPKAEAEKLRESFDEEALEKQQKDLEKQYDDQLKKMAAPEDTDEKSREEGQVKLDEIKAKLTEVENQLTEGTERIEALEEEQQRREALVAGDWKKALEDAPEAGDRFVQNIELGGDGDDYVITLQEGFVTDKMAEALQKVDGISADIESGTITITDISPEEWAEEGARAESRAKFMEVFANIPRISTPEKDGDDTEKLAKTEGEQPADDIGPVAGITEKPAIDEQPATTEETPIQWEYASPERANQLRSDFPQLNATDAEIEAAAQAVHQDGNSDYLRLDYKGSKHTITQETPKLKLDQKWGYNKFKQMIADHIESQRHASS